MWLDALDLKIVADKVRVRFAAARFAGLLDNYWRAALIVMKTLRHHTTKRPRSWLLHLAERASRSCSSAAFLA